MHKSVNNYHRHLSLTEREGSNLKHVYNRAKNRALTKDYELDDWLESEMEFRTNKMSFNHSGADVF